MEQSTYTALTGKTLSTSESTRFETIAKLAKKQLERMLGWPLCPDDWDNQYIEIGKTSSECACPDVDTSTLLAADTVVGAYRFFQWNANDAFLAIDPAIQIHAVKLVKDGVTYRTFEDSEFRAQWRNDCDEPYTKFLQVCRDCCLCQLECLCGVNQCVQLAIDADWAFDGLPIELQRVWADMIGYDYDCKKDVKSESMGSHSYSKFDRSDPVVLNASVIEHFAGPNGTSYRKARV